MPFTRKFSGYIDGYAAVPHRISRAPRRYPFAQNGDITTAMYDATYRVDVDRFVPTPRGTVDPENAGFYLIDETQPDVFQGSIATFRRTYSKIPLQQIVPASQYITKPDIPGSFPQVFGAYLIVKPVDSVSSYDAYTIVPVATDTGAPGSSYPTGGTYTLTFGGATTSALAYNASTSDVQTALNALTPVSNRGNVAVTGAYNTAAGFAVVFATAAAATVNVASLTASTGATVAAAAIATTSSGYKQQIALKCARDITTFTAASSFTPAGANPLYLSNTYPGFSEFYVGSFNSVYTPATSGTFTITVFGQTTAVIDLSVTPPSGSASIVAAFAAAVQSALNALSNVTACGGATVEFGAGTKYGFPFYGIRIGGPSITGGTYTVTLFGDTTATINHNDSLSTVSTRINALTGVTNRGGCIVSGAGFGSGEINLTLSFANPALVSAVSLTPAGVTINASITDAGTGRTQSLVFTQGSAQTRTIHAYSHGIGASDSLYALCGGVYLTGISVFTVSGDDIVFSVNSGAVFTATGTLTEVGRRFKSGYTPTVTLSRVKRVTDFYLPGVSPGITTTDDIPLPAYQGDPASLLTAIFAGSTAINYEVGELTAWKDSPIFARTVTTLNAATLT